MAKMTYGEQLKHPNWQRKRLEVLQRDEFMCQCCFSAEKTLHVHHKHYIKGRMVWEYDNDDLVSLCDECHRAQHDEAESRDRLLAKLEIDGPAGINDFFAHGAGAVSLVASDSLAAELRKFEESNPLQFWAGRVGSALADMPLLVDRLQKLVQLVEKDRRFFDDFVALLNEYGVDVGYGRKSRSDN